MKWFLFLKAQIESLGRTKAWWLPKVGPALAVAYCASLVFRVPGWATMRSIAVIAFVGLCAGSYGYLLNDIFDIEVDLRAGKSNPMIGYSPITRFAFCAIALCLGFAPALLVPTSHRTLMALGLEYLVLTVYSLPPVRLKTRGVLGLLCDASGAHVMANLFAISVLADGRTVALRDRSSVVFVALVCAWELCLGLMGISLHQWEDRENDLRSGIDTFATARSFASVRTPLNLVFGGELLAFSGLCIVLARVAPLLSLAAVFYVLVVSLKLWMHWPAFRDLSSDSTLMTWWQLSHPFYEAYFPLVVALQCAWIHPQLWPFVALHLLVCVSLFRGQFLDLQPAYLRLLLGGSLEVADESSAEVEAVLFPIPGRRIRILPGNPLPWTVRAVRAGIAMRSGYSYEIRLKIRADGPREILFGVWQNHEPWEAAGYCECISLSADWQYIIRHFTAQADDPCSYFGLWVGGDPGLVDVRRWSLHALDSKTPVQ